MNKAKSASHDDGKAFLRDALRAEQEVLRLQLELSSTSITHDSTMGAVNEQHFIALLKRYLPKRYEVDSGIVIDSTGTTSDQIDVVIFDHQYTPTLLDQQQHRFIPVEGVYCVLEVKPRVSKEYIEYAVIKAKSVRKLRRTSVPIPHAGGEFKPKQLFQIISGLVAPSTDWIGGLASPAFAQCVKGQEPPESLDCGLALSDGAFDSFDGSLRINKNSCALAWFLFRLLKRLQSLGTVPAIDWNSYASALAAEENTTDETT
jgi:hypothetical protein